MLRARTWKPSDRKYVSKGVCFSDMICPNEDPIFEAVGDLLERPFRYTRVQMNGYDPKMWPNAEPHRDSRTRAILG